MPYVNIKITNEQLSTEQKAALIAGATQLLVDTLNKNPASTFVIIDDIRDFMPHVNIKITDEKETTVVTIDEVKDSTPHVNIKITDEQVSAKDKTTLTRGATKLLMDVLNKKPATTIVIIDEVNTDNWGIGGQVVTDLRKISSSTTG